MDNINNQPLQEQEHDDTLPLAYNETVDENKAIIKVVGVGGGGSNAVENMYKEGAGIQDVSFLIINTDKAALKNSKVPNKLLISKEGLGAGAQPDKAQQFAVESEDAIRNALNDGTKMVFITAGMGGGTGTGASPVVAKIAHELGILTIGIVTIPFQFEGKNKIVMALQGVASIRQYVDALLVVNNNRLIEIYPDLNFFNAFRKADNTLTDAAKSISDIINITGYINLDFADVERTLKNSGVALISTGEASGEKRVTAAIQNAVSSPLLQDSEISKAKHLLFELCFSEQSSVSMEEISELNEFVNNLNPDIDVIWGAMVDNTLGENVRMIVLASGFDIADDGTIIASNIELRADKEKAAKEAEEAAKLAEEAAKQAEAAAKQAEEEEKNRKAEEATAAAETPAVETDEVAIEGTPEKSTLVVETTPVVAEEEPAVAPVTSVATTMVSATPAPTAPVTATPVTPAAANSEPQVIPTSNPLQGIESIRMFYGDETANGMIQNDIRSRYYMLDNKDLTNDQLIDLLEHLPAYNRTAEQYSELKSVAANGNNNTNRGNDTLDGTIHFK